MLPLKRPIATGAVYVAILLLGLGAMVELPLSLSPDLDYPALSVQLAWPNSTPEEMEALVTSPVESEVQLLRGAREVSSTSGAGWARVDVSFERKSSIDRAEVFLRERLSALQDRLPVGVRAPEIERFVPEEMQRGDFLVLQVEGPRTDQALREWVDDRIAPRLLGVEGISGLTVFGGREPELRVDLDRDALDRGIITPAAITGAFGRIGRDRSLGVVRRGDESIPVVLDRPAATAANLRERVVAGTADAPLRVGQVAAVADAWEDPVRLARIDGHPAITLVLEREPGSNVLTVVRAVRRMLDTIRTSLPSDVSIEVLHDQSESIGRELSSLARRSLISIVAIFLVLLVSERRWRAPLTVLSAVLFSALGTFLAFRAAGIGINLVTLSGLALAFGMAVDNSIVILQNVALRTRDAANPLHTLAATREVLFPLLAATATTAVVLTPFLYMTGDLRDYYLPFVLSVTLSLTASLFVALSLTPLLARWALTDQTRQGRRDAAARFGRTRATLAYTRWLELLLRRPLVVALTAAIVFGGSVVVFDRLVSHGSIFPSQNDTSLRVGVRFPPGTDLRSVDALIGRFEQAVLEHPYHRRGYIEKVQAMVMESRGMLTVRFAPEVSLTAVPQSLKEELTAQAAAISGASVSVSGYGPGFSGSGGRSSPSYQLRVRGPDYLELERLAEDLGHRLARHPRVREIDTNASNWLVEDAIEMALVPDRQSIARYGLSMREVASAIQPAIAGELSLGRLPTEDGEVNARIRVAGGEALAPEELLATRVPTPSGASVPLGELARLEERPVPAEILRRDQQYERIVTFDFRGPRPIADRYVRSFVEGTTMPPGYTLDDGLGSYLTGKEERAIGLALAFALLLIYLVSAALFESLLLPFVAILSVPLGFIGIALTFWLAKMPFDRTAYVGLILLAGIAVNNALLWVHRAGQLYRRTANPLQSALRASSERWVPILMTTLTGVAGLLPLAIGSDPGTSGDWRTLALSTTAGLTTSSLVTLTVVPALFLLFLRRRARPLEAAASSN